MSQEIPLLTYNSLYNILREEKKNKSLQKTDEKLYEAIQKFLEEKENLIKNLEKENNSENLKKEKNISKNSKKIIQEVLTLRFSKISSIAIENFFHNENILNEKNILEKEEKFLNIVKEGIKITNILKL